VHLPTQHRSGLARFGFALVLAGLSVAIPFYRNLAGGKGSGIGVAAAVFVTAEMLALFASTVVLLQHGD
jgi:hypothetical protein